MRKQIGFLLLICLLMLSNTLPAFTEAVTKSNADVIVKVGEKYTLEAVLKYFIEKQIPLNIKVNWETSDSKIATVANGVITGAREGGVIIKASATNEGKNYRAEAKVYVASTVTGVSLNTDTIEIKVGQSEKLIEKVLPDTAILKTVTWKSEDSKIASVSGGTVKGLSKGSTYITVTTNDGGYIARCLVKVSSSVIGVTLKEHSLTKFVGEEFFLEHSILPSNAFLKDVKWSSGNTKIVSVSGGKAKALSAGSTTIRIETVDGKFTDECVVRVNGMVTGITLNKDNITILKGNKDVVGAVVSPDNAIEKGIIWKSENSKVASVSDGLITALNEGETTISATTKDGNFKAMVKVTVVSYDQKLESIDLAESEITVNAGETRWLLYKTYPETVVPKLKVICTSLTDKSTIPVQIKNNSVYIEAKKAGSYKIVLSLEGDSDINDHCIIHIRSMVTGAEISNTNIEMFIGEKFQLSGNALPDTALIKGVTWKSSDSKIAKVNTTTGEVTGVGAGNCIITASTIDGGFEAKCRVTVKNPVDIESLKLRDSEGNIIGEKQEQTMQNTSSDKDEISITIDGVSLEMDQPPILLNDRVLAPVRVIFENLGATVYWNDEIQMATGIMGSKVIQLTIEDAKAFVNGELITLDVPAKIVNGRTLVPVRFIAESLGVNVDWDDANQTVVITTE